jgi:predicted NBD/HSP70 family sugar kinase
MSTIEESKGKNPTQMQLENRSTLLKLLRRNNYICRKDLAEMSGLTSAAVTNLIRDLINVGLVEEVKEPSINLGRNAIPLKLSLSKFLVVGACFRRNGLLSYGISDLGGNIIKKYEIKQSVDKPASDILDDLYSRIKTLTEELSSQGKVIGLGLAFPGPINMKKGEIQYLTNLPGWENVPVLRFFEEQFKLPVILDDVANAIAIAESWFGIGKNHNNLISILLSKGVGAGVITNGHIYHGSFGFAGQIGHVSINYNGPQCECGNKGCLELYCSTLALLKRAREIYDEQKIASFNDIKTRFDQGDPRIIEIVKEVGFYLGIAIVNLVNSYNPSLIVLNGEMTVFGSALLNSIKETVQSRLTSNVFAELKIEYSSLQEDPVLLGAIAMICEYFFNHPDLRMFL